MGVNQEVASKSSVEYRKIDGNCVSWMMASLERFKNAVELSRNYPNVSRYRDTMYIATILELMDILNVKFESKYAAINILSKIDELDIIEPKTITEE